VSPAAIREFAAHKVSAAHDPENGLMTNMSAPGNFARMPARKFV